MSISWILSTATSEKPVKVLIIATTRSWIHHSSHITPQKKKIHKIKHNIGES